MEAAIELHQLAEVRLPLAALAIGRPLALPAPQSRRQHPAAQRLVVDRQPVLTRQVLRHQRRPEARRHVAAVFLPDQPQHPLPRRRRRPAIGAGPPGGGAGPSRPPV